MPLARAETEHSCSVPWRTAQHGVTRESHRAAVPGGDILQGGDVARTYQNLVGDQVSRYVLDAIQPALVFSGDDHDHCETIHYGHRMHPTASVRGFDTADVPELTVKSMSMLEGVARPGYAWLELGMRDRVPTMEYRPCLLPNQLALWLSVYVPVACISMIALAVLAARRSVGPKSSLPMYRRVNDAAAPRRPWRTLLQRAARSIGLVAVVPLGAWICLQL